MWKICIFFSLCSPLDCFKISFYDECIFHSASAVSLPWIEPRFPSNLDLAVYQALDGFSCLLVIVHCSWLYISGGCYWLCFGGFFFGWMFPSLRLFYSYTLLQNGSYGDTVKYLSMCLALPSVIFAFWRKGGIMTSHPHCFCKAKPAFYSIYLFYRAFSVHFLLTEGLY